jgi:hypothetical protein
MTSPGQLGQASDDSNQPPQKAHESLRHTRRRSAGRFPLPRNKGTWFWITVSLIALAGVALVIGSGSHQATSGNTSAATTPAGTSAATGGAPAAAGSIKASQVNQAPNSSSKAKGKGPTAAQVAASGGALRLPANTQSSVIAWQAGPGGKDLAAVTRLFGDALQAGGARQYAQMRSACIQLTHSVSTAEAGPQIPVAAMQMLYGKALAELAKGAVDCQAAIAVKPGAETLGATVNAAKRQQAASELGAGARDIFRSTAEIEIASRQSH